MCFIRENFYKFTMKHDLPELEQGRDDNSSKQTTQHSTREKISSCRVLNKACIFCPGKSAKYLKGTNTREHLIFVQCVELQVDAKYKKCMAVKHNDTKFSSFLT